MLSLDTPDIDWIEIPAGIYSVGSDSDYWDTRPAHPVELKYAFRIAAHPVTNEQFEAFVPRHKADRKFGGDAEPVANVSWKDANSYCQWLSQTTEASYRLPTEAEWEIAASLHPNKLQLSFELENWCLDWYGTYPERAENPCGCEAGVFRVVRGGSWRAPKHGRTNLFARLGALPDDRIGGLGFRLVMSAEPIWSFSHPEVVPNWAKSVGQSLGEWRSFTHEPFFGEPVEYVKIPNGETGPLFSRHNHDPAITWCPNGDVIAIWYSTLEESGRELAIAGSRYRNGLNKWDEAAPFWDTPGRNDHAPGLLTDRAGNIYHFNGIAETGGWQSLGLIVRKSTDNGRSWTIVHEDFRRGWGNQVVASAFQSADGQLYLPCDENPGPSGGTVLHVGSEGGTRWSRLNEDSIRPNFAEAGVGPWIAGIHAGIDEWIDGTFVAVGRGDEIGGRMPISVSHDHGRTWTYSATPFPALGTGQRAVLRRLRENALLLVSFAANGSEIGVRGSGMFAAISYDGGKTWPIRRLLTDGIKRKLDGRGWTGVFEMDALHAEPKGYLAAIQSPDRMIHLISSGVHYRFNLKWLEAPAT